MNLSEAFVHLETCKTIEELRLAWHQFWPGWKQSLGPIELRLVVAKKDEVKLNLARELLRQNTEDVDITAILLTTIRSMFESGGLQEAWPELAKSQLTDRDVTDPTEALFLFALRLVQFIDSEKLLDTWERYRPWWKRRLPVPAYQIICDAFYKRHRELNMKAFKEAKYGQF